MHCLLKKSNSVMHIPDLQKVKDHQEVHTRMPRLFCLHSATSAVCLICISHDRAYRSGARSELHGPQNRRLSRLARQRRQVQPVGPQASSHGEEPPKTAFSLAIERLRRPFGIKCCYMGH